MTTPTSSPTRPTATPIGRVAVIGGGTSCEHDVSLASAAGVADALVAGGHDVVRLTIDPEGVWRDAGDRPLGLAGAVHVLRSCAVAVPVVHGPGGEDGTLAGLLDLADVPYVGSGVGAGALAMDKWATKLVAEALGLATAPGVLLTRATSGAYLAGPMDRPVVVKPVAAGSSHGVSLVREPGELAAALDAAFALDDRVLVEDVVVGREVDVAVLATGTELLVSPALEIRVDGLFDFDAKYGGGADFVVPAPLSSTEQKALESAALAMFTALGCRGVARVDFFLTEAGPVLNEVNTMPGFTEHSQVPQMFAAAGIDYVALVDRLVRDAVAGPVAARAAA